MRLASRYNGPRDSANGGVTAGRLSAYVGAPAVRVTLRRPPPLDVDLRVDASGGRAWLYDGDVMVAEAVPTTVDLDPGPPVSVEQALATPYPGNARHPYPTCFVCGTEREDGLGLRPGPLPDGRFACAWTPQKDDPVLVWAALDCPGGWAADLPGSPKVLGRIALRRLGELRPGEPHVVTGWTRGQEARKTFTGTALHTADGQLLAVAEATWIAVP